MHVFWIDMLYYVYDLFNPLYYVYDLFNPLCKDIPKATQNFITILG